jgi:5'-nucleotidase (lipoprotein e(P4) family)
MTSRPSIVSALALALTAGAACRSAAPAAPASVPSPPASPSTLTGDSHPLALAVRWVRASAEHRALFLQTYRAATAHVEREAAGRPPGSWAVVLDADETVIDNSLFEAERVEKGISFGSEHWSRWTARREATPLPGAAAFLARVRALGGRIAIVTNRTESACPDTEAVFRAHALAYDVMLCKPEPGPSDKNPRFEAVARGTTPAGLPPLEVVAFVGDNINDFPGQGQSIRTGPEEAFAAFGARFFVLPNPMYGSWERD